MFLVNGSLAIEVLESGPVRLPENNFPGLLPKWSPSRHTLLEGLYLHTHTHTDTRTQRIISPVTWLWQVAEILARVARTVCPSRLLS